MSGKKIIESSILGLPAILAALIMFTKIEAAANDWRQSRLDAENTAGLRTESQIACKPQSWSFKLDQHVWGYQPAMAVWSSASLAVIEDRAVVAVGSYDHNVYLFNACNGEQLWRYTTGGGVYQAPVIRHDGQRTWIYATSSDRLAYGLDAVTGERIWSTAVYAYRPTLGGARLSSPSVGYVRQTPAVFVGFWVFDKSLKHNLQQGGLTALEASSGKILWNVEFLDNRVSAPLYVSGRNDHAMILISSEDGNLRALDADTGRVLWHHREIEPIMGSAAWFQSNHGPRVIIGSHFGKIRCLDAADGRQIWSFKTGNWVTGSPTVYEVGQRKMIAVGSYDQNVYGLDAETGRKIWSSSTSGPVYSGIAFIQRADPIVLASSFDHHLYGISAATGKPYFAIPTGSPIWDAIPLGENPWSSPVAAYIGDTWMIYHGSYDATLYAVTLEQALQAGLPNSRFDFSYWITMLIVMGVTAMLAWLKGKPSSGRKT